MFEKLYIQPGIWSITSEINEVSRLKFSINVHSAEGPLSRFPAQSSQKQRRSIQEPPFLCVS